MARRSLWRVVKELNADGQLALFVGAGVSMSCGLPGWTELVSRVLTTTWKDQPDLAALLIKDKNILAARYARQKAGTKFNRIVHEALYQNDVELSGCVWAIARSGVRQICTFNFDDLLAEALLTEGRECVIATPDEPFQTTFEGSTTVYHPHGILPRFYRDSELDAAKIVFSEDDYHNLYSDPYSWANIAQLSLLTSKSALFIGLSMQDPNLRRLVDIARARGFTNQHFAVFRDPTARCSPADVDEHIRLRKLLEIDMKSLGVTTWFVDSHEKVAEIVESIAVKSASNRGTNTG